MNRKHPFSAQPHPNFPSRDWIHWGRLPIGGFPKQDACVCPLAVPEPQQLHKQKHSITSQSIDTMDSP